MGVCIICNNLDKKEMAYDGKEIECYRCKLGKFDANNIEWHYSLKSILKPIKSIKDIQEKCDSWDDRLKAKV